MEQTQGRSARGPERLRLRQRVRRGPVALSIVLVVGAGLFVRALDRAPIDPGFDPRASSSRRWTCPLAGYTPTQDAFQRELIQRVRRLPAWQSRRLARCAARGGGLGLGGLRVPGVEPPNGRRFFDADWNVVTPGYFATMKMASRRPGFHRRDPTGSPSVVTQ